MSISEQDAKFMRRAIELAQFGMEENSGGPFGSVVVMDGRVIGEGYNCVTSANDPTAHAEVMAIRNACKELNTFSLEGATVYASCEPCPMCMGAIYWSRAGRIVIACNREDAADAGFDDAFIYDEIGLGHNERSIAVDFMLRDEGLKAFNSWKNKPDKIEY